LGQQADDEKQSGVRLFYFARALDLIKSALKAVEKEKKKQLTETVQFAYDVISLWYDVIRNFVQIKIFYKLAKQVLVVRMILYIMKGSLKRKNYQNMKE
jgi:hypothetical protein